MSQNKQDKHYFCINLEIPNDAKDTCAVRNEWIPLFSDIWIVGYYKQLDIMNTWIMDSLYICIQVSGYFWTLEKFNKIYQNVSKNVINQKNDG